MYFPQRIAFVLVCSSILFDFCLIAFSRYMSGDFELVEDSLPLHWANATRDFLWNVPDLISAEEWALNSTDFPLDYSFTDNFQEIVYEGRHQPYANLHELCGLSAFWRLTLLCLVSWLKYEKTMWIFVYISTSVCLLKIQIWFNLFRLKCFIV